MKIFARAVPALLFLGLGACSDAATLLVCPSRPHPSLVVWVVDAETGLSVSEQASGTWRSGDMADSLHHVSTGDGSTVLAAFGPPGTYQVRVLRPGHADWVRDDIVVPPGQCGPARVEFTATHAIAT
ncbi:MAG TPA: carboxypeptidase-like regulatory domain-containing protein [Longimicrobium sp.]|nr:carboxypeptidase-like regulatory domain-containing protein [Longimicrobium sp.]